ncbi:hypothetical protein [Apilactobacillus quenuiae]|uniref:hypothetical protein n=1 Tax=Apilactobacillus quenuiae TaxID=2008377 RepID=UPI0012FFEB83|nr:hypothetical protein [Apilactobacillus quenuiae]
MLQINVILGSSRKTALGKNLFNYLKTNKSYYEKLTNATFNFIEISQYELPSSMKRFHHWKINNELCQLINNNG